MDYPYTHPFWYVFMTAVLSSMVAVVLCWGLQQGIRALQRAIKAWLAQGGHL